MSAAATEKAPKATSVKKDDDFIPKPDRSKFLDKLNGYRKELEQHRLVLTKQKQNIDSVQSSSTQSPEETKLREEHSAVLAERNRLRDVEKQINAQAKKLEDGIHTKVTELQLLRPKSGPRSVKEIDQKIERLDSEVESGTLTIASEKRNLNEITALKRMRSSFARADKLQEEIDSVRNQAAEVRKAIDAKAMRQVQANKAELEKKLDQFKEKRQAVRSKLNASYDDRRSTHNAIKELNSKMDALRADFDAEMAAFNDKMKAKKQQREAEEAEAKQKNAQQKKVQEAEAKVAAAKEPAYAAQIDKAKRLLEYFDPSSASAGSAVSTETAPSSAGSADSSKSVSKALNAPAVSGQALPQQSAGGAPPSRKSQKKKSSNQGPSQSLNLDLGIIDALSSLKVSLPSTAEQLEHTKTQLREKIEFYTENNTRVTKERVERAEEELQKVLAATKN